MRVKFRHGAVWERSWPQGLVLEQGWMQQLCLQRARGSLTLLAVTLRSAEESLVLE